MTVSHRMSLLAPVDVTYRRRDRPLGRRLGSRSSGVGGLAGGGGAGAIGPNLARIPRKV
jgi:hypothetical protein